MLYFKFCCTICSMTLINQASQFDADLMLVSHVADVVSEYYNRSLRLHSVKNVSKNSNGQIYTTN